jgi:hypothetical protein
MTTTLREQMVAKLRERVYLGDGVYARHDGYQVWIDTGNGCTIALEDGVMKNLVQYHDLCGQLAAINKLGSN